MRIAVAVAALADLAEIDAFIASDNRLAARRVLQGLKSAGRGLSKHPRRFPLLAERPQSGIRRRPVGSYQIFYIIDEDAVTIIRILHGARDYVAILFGES